MFKFEIDVAETFNKLSDNKKDYWTKLYCSETNTEVVDDNFYNWLADKVFENL
jgi:hypothetical protein